jgi:DNA-directed RNA polymerase subunit alpha
VARLVGLASRSAGFRPLDLSSRASWSARRFLGARSLERRGAAAYLARSATLQDPRPSAAGGTGTSAAGARQAGTMMMSDDHAPLSDENEIPYGAEETAAQSEARTALEEADAATARRAAADPIALLKEPFDHATIHAFRKAVFGHVNAYEKLRDWVDSPMSTGVARGLAQWALGRHEDALESFGNKTAESPAIADCAARSMMALRRFDEAEALLKNKDTDDVQLSTWLHLLDARGDAEALGKAVDANQSRLGAADVAYFKGRRHELEGESVRAIAAYDETLVADPNHREALFRLAVLVDLRGEDEEARELYERALMVPPVNTAVVMNLGVLYEDMGNYRRAMQCFDLVLSADPTNRRAKMYRRDASAALNMYYDEDQERREDKRNKILRTPINDFELSVRSRNCLAKMGVRTLGDLVKKTEQELLSYKNFGETSLLEIKEVLKSKGLRLGMGTDELMSTPMDVAEPVPVVAEEGDMPDPNSADPSRRPVTELDLSVRARRIIDLLKIRTIGDLANKTEAELLACPNFGQTSLNEIKTKLDEYGLSLRG